LKSKKDEIEKTRIRTKELGNQKTWLNWIEKYGHDLELKHDLSDGDQKECLEGLLEKIEIRLNKDTNDHHLDIIFKMGLVNDGIEYVNPKRKSGRYRVVEGDKTVKLVISHEQIRKMHKEARITGRRKQNEKKFQRNN
jgi:hypothetical protein